MGGRKAPSVRRCLLRPRHRPARRERQDAANVPCEGNVQCKDGSLTLYAGAKSPGVDRESNWLPASGTFSLYIRAYWAGGPVLDGQWETAACQASTIGQLTTACATWFRDANEDDISNVGCWHTFRAWRDARPEPVMRNKADVGRPLVRQPLRRKT